MIEEIMLEPIPEKDEGGSINDNNNNNQGANVNNDEKIKNDNPIVFLESDDKI